MKKLLVIGALCVTAAAALGQGTLNFNTRVLTATPPVDAPGFLDSLTGAKLEGAAYSAQLYAGTASGALSAIGSVINFRTGSVAGYLNGGALTLNQFTPGSTIFVQVRAWATASGTTYEAATAAQGIVGTSNEISVRLGGDGSPPALPGNLVGLQPFFVAAVPEPSTIALGLLGLAALALRRRK